MKPEGNSSDSQRIIRNRLGNQGLDQSSQDQVSASNETEQSSEPHPSGIKRVVEVHLIMTDRYQNLPRRMDDKVTNKQP